MCITFPADTGTDQIICVASGLPVFFFFWMLFPLMLLYFVILADEIFVVLHKKPALGSFDSAIKHF